MLYSELTLNQKISLKGYFKTEPSLSHYYAIMMLWNFVIAVNFFLSDDDLSLLTTYYKLK
jgi:hypothetical protein